MLIEAGYPKRLGTPRRAGIETGRDVRSADSMTSPPLWFAQPSLCRRPSGFFVATSGCAVSDCSTIRFGQSEFNSSRRASSCGGSSS
jgi:hypothetical protein